MSLSKSNILATKRQQVKVLLLSCCRDGWVAKTEEGKLFDDVDLTEKEWSDYDEKQNQTVGVYEVKWNFKKI